MVDPQCTYSESHELALLSLTDLPSLPLPSSPQLDGLGRKYLLLLGIAIQSSGHFILFLAFALSSQVNIAVYVLGSSLILGGFSLGLGPITWLLQSEIFPTLIRGRAMGFSVIMRNLCEFLINFAFLSLTGLIGDHGIFLLFFLLCVLALLFVKLVFVETKEKEPNEILQEFQENYHRLRSGKVSLFSRGEYNAMLCVNDDSVHEGGAGREGEGKDETHLRL
jgi:MFS family permease